MKVSELIEQLKSHDPEATVFTYSQIDEGGDETNKVFAMEDAKAKLYFKGDAPWDCYDCENFVVVG
jgi:hypothetical protein